MNPFRPSVVLSCQSLVSRYPYRSTAIVFTSFFLPLALLSLLLERVLRGMPVPLGEQHLLGEPLIALIAALLISFLGWRWSGFNRITWQGVKVCIGAMPLMVLPLLALPFLVGKASGSVIAMAVVAGLLTGFVQESFFRGLMLRILLPKGIWHSIILTSLLFACIPFINLLHGFSWTFVIGQMIGGLGLGILFATVRLRTGSIWPTVLFEAVSTMGFFILLGSNPQVGHALSFNDLFSSSIVCLLFIINALCLLRSKQLQQLRVDYGLDKSRE